MIKSVREDVAETIERVAVGGQRADEGVDLAWRASVLLADIREKTNAAFFIKRKLPPQMTQISTKSA
jgi:hypothetical protein